MDEIRNRINRSGTKCYTIVADHKSKKATPLENNPMERVKISYNGGMISADRAELGTWRVSERFNLSSSETFETFEEAVKEFENRTEVEPPTPVWRKG